MNKEELFKEIERFNRRQNRLMSLVPGQLIYEQELADPLGGSYFTHEVVSVNLEKMCVNTLDHSLNKRPSMLYSFDLGNEVGLPNFE